MADTALHVRLRDAARRIAEHGREKASPQLDADIVARHILGWDRTTLLARRHEPEPEGFAAAFEPLLQRRINGEPVAYLVGEREFWGLDFEVTRDVLIPRPESELIVEEGMVAAADLRAAHPTVRVIDVGTGSGCLAVALASELTTDRVLAIDASRAALAVAARNAARHGVCSRVQLIAGDMLTALAASPLAHIVVSNPPYVPERTTLPINVVAFEPALALYSGGDGLGHIKRLLADTADRLVAGGRLIFEFGLGHEDEVTALVERAGWRVVRIRKDLQGIARTITLTLPPA